MRELRMSFGREKKVFILRAACIGGLIVLLAGSSARAALVEVEIVGQVTYVDDRDEVLGGQIQANDTFVGSYSYDPFLADSNPLAGVGDYEHLSSPFGITLNINGLVFASNPQEVDFLIELYNDYGSTDRYMIISTGNLPLDGVEVSQIMWQLNDATCGALNSDDLLMTAPVLSDWQSNNFRITCGNNGATRITGTIIEAYTGRVIPEPTTVILMGLGAVVLCRRRA